MAEAKKKKEQFTTPEGEVLLAFLNKPSTKFKEDGEYSVKLKFHKSKIAALLSKLEPVLEQAYAAGEEAFAELPKANRTKLGEITKDALFTPVYDEEDEETDYVEISFKTAAVRKDKQTGEKYAVKVPVFSAGSDKALKKVPNIGKGTTAKVSFSVTPYFVTGTGACGLTKYLNAVQIIDLVEFGGGSASGFGFSKEEGYEPDADDEDDVAEVIEEETEEVEAPKTTAKKGAAKRSATDF